MQKTTRITLLSIVLSTVLIAGTVSGMAANPSTVKIFVNDSELSMYDQEVKKEIPAILYKSRTLVPLKKTFEIYGLSIKWNAKDQVIESMTSSGKKIWLQVNNAKAKVGNESLVLDVPARVISNRTYVPLAFIGKAIGNAPEWDAENYIVNIYTDGTNDLNLKLIPATYGLPMRNNNKITFVASNEKRISIKKENVNFFDGIALMAKSLFAKSTDFTMAYETENHQMAIFVDSNIGMERNNIVLNNRGTVYLIEVVGEKKADAIELIKKLIK